MNESVNSPWPATPFGQAGKKPTAVLVLPRNHLREIQRIFTKTLRILCTARPVLKGVRRCETVLWMGGAGVDRVWRNTTHAPVRFARKPNCDTGGEIWLRPGQTARAQLKPESESIKRANEQCSDPRGTGGVTWVGGAGILRAPAPLGLNGNGLQGSPLSATGCSPAETFKDRHLSQPSRRDSPRGLN